mmetsp:Transcript_1816/g.3435  ORF Transcript_1816/g.3435 Transcript_1816/m.3435 type:complete len:111 (+) Transcript_1816:2592-2924(+)
MSVKDAAFLSDFTNRASNVYVLLDGANHALKYDVESQVMRSFLPWSCAFLLTRYNKKHIFTRKSALNVGAAENNIHSATKLHGSMSCKALSALLPSGATRRAFAFGKGNV